MYGKPCLKVVEARTRHGILAEIFKWDHTVLQNPCQKAVLVSIYGLTDSVNPCLKPVSFSIYGDTVFWKPVSKKPCLIPYKESRDLCICLDLGHGLYRISWCNCGCQNGDWNQTNFTLLYINAYSFRISKVKTLRWMCPFTFC